MELAVILLDRRKMIKASLHQYWLQLKQPWAIASRLGKQGQGISRRGVWLLKLEDESGNVGYGEAAPVLTYGEDLTSVFGFLGRLDWTALSFEALEESLATLHALEGNAAARCAVEIALLDGASKLKHTPVGSLLGIKPSTHQLPPTSYSIGIGTPDQVRDAARASQEFPIIKLKAGPNSLEATLKAFREIRPEAPVRIDGNEAWKTKEIALQQIELAAKFGPIEFIEQPMPRDLPIEDLAWLKERSPLPLLADESFRGIESIERCVAGFHGINVKLVKSGGLRNAKESIARANDRGLKVQLGCMIESSLGIAAALQLAPLADWLDLDGSLLTQNDPFEGLFEKFGRLKIGQSDSTCGIGVNPKIDYWNQITPEERPVTSRARVDLSPVEYGRSVNGIPLEVYLPSTGQCDLLIFASIHGEESETTALLSKALRSLDRPAPHCACVLNANPDGTLLGTRGNARGVELNRNFPSSNWKAGTVSTKWAPDFGQVEFSTGVHAGSEPETKALIRLVTQLRPKTIIALHAPLACIEDPEYSPLGYRLARTAKLPLVGNIGYETPGSFGSWAKENKFHVITYELPPVSVSAMHGQHLINLVEVLTHGTKLPQTASATG